MARFWTCHWQFRTWLNRINSEFEPVCLAGSNNFKKRGVSVSDVVYIVSLNEGQLYLGGRMVVKQIVTRRQAVRLWNNNNLYEADDWIVDPAQEGTPLHLHRRLAPPLTRQLRFRSRSGPKEPFFVSDTRLDNQATRGVRELMPESAALLDRIIEVTDRLPRTGQDLIVTDEVLAEKQPFPNFEQFRLPDEIPPNTVFNEGAVSRVEVNRYERDPEARLACIAAHGTSCSICRFSFGSVYGPEAEEYIHVHHLRPLSENTGEHPVDPIADLLPVCPNCHAVLHLGGRCRSIEEVQSLIRQQKLSATIASASDQDQDENLSTST